MLALDPPDHTRLRRLVNRAFTPRSVAKLEDFIRATAHGLVDKVEGADEFDLMKAFAAPLPMIVIARMIGVPERDLDRFRAWSSRLARALEPILPPDEQELVYRSDQQLAEYFTAIIEQRRRERRDDLVSRLVEVEELGESPWDPGRAGREEEREKGRRQAVRAQRVRESWGHRRWDSGGAAGRDRLALGTTPA